MTSNKASNVAPVANLLGERVREPERIVATEYVPNPARPDGRAIHYGDFSRQPFYTTFVGVRNPARPGEGPSIMAILVDVGVGVDLAHLRHHLIA